MKDFRENINELLMLDDDNFGAVIWDALDATDNFSNEMAMFTKTAFRQCKNEREFYIADTVFMALTNYSITSLIGKYKELWRNTR